MRRPRFDRSTAVVTGAARGIGLATCQRLADEGARVVMIDRDEAALADAAAAMPGPAETVVIDLADAEQIESSAADLRSRYDAIDVVVNNAGVGWKADVGDHPTRAWDKVMDVNARAQFLLVRELLGALQRSERAAVVNVASTATHGVGGQASYDASKGAVVALTKALAVELGCWGVRVNAVCPGMIDTGMLAAVPDLVSSELAKVPLRRVGTPREVAATIAFLASEQATYITGQALGVDGGWYRYP